MVTIYKLSPEKITTRRIDPWHYQPNFENQILKVEKFGSIRLRNVIDTDRGVASGATPLGANYLSKGRVRFYRTSEVDNMHLSSSDAVFISDEDDEKLKRSRLEAGDVLLTITGAKFGKSAVVKEEHLPGNISQHSVRFHPLNGVLDPYFLVSYFESKTGQMAIWREAYGATRPAIDFPSIEALVIPHLTFDAQKYIGEKVRQAERLRAWAKELSSSVQHDFVELIGTFDRTPSIYESISPEFLSTRLDQNHYQKHLVENAKKLISIKHVVLGNNVYFSNLTDGDHGNPKYGDGPIYLRASEISNGLIDVGRAVNIEQNYANQISQSCWAEEGDIIFSIVGTLGLTAIIDKSTRGVMSRGVAKVKSNVLPKYYVKAFFKSDYFNLQLQRHAVGSVQRGVYISALEHLIIPTFDEQVMATIAEKEHLADKVTNTLGNLTVLAKLLVEDLIEGHVTESQLASAQQALEAGDDSIDRALLERMTAEGIDGEGDPLFDDIDQLYELLEQAKQALDADDAMAEA
ncbi:restriction endonuclease subunit S [Vibrio parahaemolyticus]|nr:restriction endonuclease subunit S [Vibrio parahaemolyticus]ELA8379287.1 restriction endonuclease subunit S [Vibrio parahaemolyticus]